MDMTRYQDLFFEEAAEHLQSLNQNLLLLENNPDRLDLLDIIFRAAHTVKGMSATMGYDQVARLTHQMEDLLDNLRERRIDLNDAVFNSLFKAADILEGMIETLRSGNDLRVNIDELTKDLFHLEKTSQVINKNEDTAKISVSPASICNESSTSIVFDNDQNFNDYEVNLIKSALESGFKAWRIEIAIAKSCVMKGVRAFMAIRNLENLGDLIKTIPSVQDIEDEKFDEELVLYLVATQSLEAIRQALAIISEVQVIEIAEIGGHNGKTQPECIRENTTRGPEATVTIPEAAAAALESAAAVPEATAAAPVKKAQVHQTVRVDITRLDNLMSLVGELVINKTRLERINQTKQLASLGDTIEGINRITTDLQNVVQNVRMVSIEQVFNRFPRMVRDQAKELGKEVNLVLEGKETELDRTVIDEIGDPLVHLIRNALDHGLESTPERIAAKKNNVGTLKLTAKQQGNQVIIIVEDDGRGIDIEQIREKALRNGLISQAQLETIDEQMLMNLIFESGFSTAPVITDLSGRGVGLDVVKSKIQSLNGSVSLETKRGAGTRFIIKLPLTLAIIQALLVKVQDETYAIPLANIDETTTLKQQQIKKIQEQQVVMLRGRVLPLVFMKEALAVPGGRQSEDLYVVVVRKGEKQVGLVAEELLGQQEIVINSLGKLLSGIQGIAGASILGDGSVSLILDTGTLF